MCFIKSDMQFKILVTKLDTPLSKRFVSDEDKDGFDLTRPVKADILVSVGSVCNTTFYQTMEGHSECPYL